MPNNPPPTSRSPPRLRNVPSATRSQTTQECQFSLRDGHAPPLARAKCPLQRSTPPPRNANLPSATLDDGTCASRGPSSTLSEGTSACQGALCNARRHHLGTQGPIINARCRLPAMPRCDRRRSRRCIDMLRCPRQRSMHPLGHDEVVASTVDATTLSVPSGQGDRRRWHLDTAGKKRSHR